jgi:hypothetical protein
MKNFRILTVALLFVASNLAIGSNVPKSKEFNKEFNVNENTKLVVKNKFGQVNIQNWDKSSIQINVVVKVDSRNESKATALLDAINVSLTKEDDKVLAITTFDDEFSRANRRLFQSSNNEISIDYTIKMPKYVDTKIENKFGDIFINELDSHLEVALKYGNIVVNKLTRGDAESLNEIQVSYGNASVVDANWAKFEVKYGKLIVENLVAGVVLSRYSKIDIENVSSLVLESKYDKYEVESVKNLVGESGYTVFSISELKNKFQLSAKYGDVKIQSVGKNFDEIVFEAAYTGFKAGIPESSSYKIDAFVSYGNVDLGDRKTRLNRIEKNTSVKLLGVVGTSSSPKSKVTLRMKYGNADLD